MSAQFDISNFLADYLTKGFYRFNAEEVLSKFNIDLFMPMKTGDHTFKTTLPEERYNFYFEKQKRELYKLKDLLLEYYFVHFNCDLRFNDMWASVGENVTGWHSDRMNCWPGFNSSVNCYFDTSSPETGGELQLSTVVARPPDQGGPKRIVESVYPERFDVIVINQGIDFLHQVTPSPIQRRMISHAAAFYDFNQ